MIELKAYVLTIQPSNVSVSIHRTLETIHAAWESVEPHNDLSVFLVHIGFSRPSTEGLSNFCEDFSGRVLVSASTKFSLPPKYRFSETQIGQTDDGIPLFVALNGWGYEIDDEYSSAVNSGIEFLNIPPRGWLVDLQTADKECFDFLYKQRVYDEASYVEFTVDSPEFEYRDRVDDFRFKYLLKETNENSPFQILRISPKWFLDVPISKVNLTVRLANVFETNGVEYVRDILKFKESELLSFKNMGRKSIRDLAICLLNAVSKGTFGETLRNGTAVCDDSVKLFECLNSALDAIVNPRDKEIIEQRLGFNSEPQTLEEIGVKYGLTRERVRQILKKNLNKIIDKCSWDDLISVKINKILQNRKKPLYLELIEIEDDWFTGFSNNLIFLARVIEEFTNDEFQLNYLGEYRFVSRIRKRDLDELLKSFGPVLQDCASKKMPISDVRLICSSLLNARKCGELLDLVFEHYTPRLGIGVNNVGDESLVSFGLGVEGLLKVIFEESSTPLHFSEVTKLASIKAGREVNERTVHNLLGGNYIVFSQGTYGDEKHIPLTKDQQDEVRAITEEMILTGSHGKQWHCTELVDPVVEQVPELAETLDHYIINHLLKKSECLKYLKRMVWIPASEQTVVNDRRIEYAQSFEVVLEEVGKPLKSDELKLLLQKKRGVHSGLQIFPTDRMIRLEPGLWGLKDRDVKLSHELIAKCFNVFYEHLVRTNKAIHLTELVGVLSNGGVVYLRHLNHPYVFFGLSKFDDRFKVTKGDFLAMSSWTNIGRYNLTEAVGKIVDEMDGPRSINEIHNDVIALTERDVARNHVANHLIKQGAIYNKLETMWYPPRQAETIEPFQE